MTIAGKTFLITGSTDGVGRCMALRLAASGANLLIHGRNRERAERLLAEIKDAGGSAAFYQADLASLAEVRRLAREVQRDQRKLDGLINNAGIGFGGPRGKRETSFDGFELRFAVNYLSAFLLTRLVLPLLRHDSPSRIVNVASIGQQPIDFDNVMLSREYSGVRAYCQSKLASVMFTFDLAEELRSAGIAVNCLHPATYMNTTMVKMDGITPATSVEEGAEAILNLAIGREIEGKTGLYFDGLRPSRPNRQACDLAARARLRALSYQLVDLEEPSGLRSDVMGD